MTQIISDGKYYSLLLSSLAVVGAIISQMVLGRWHKKELGRRAAYSGSR